MQFNESVYNDHVIFLFKAVLRNRCSLFCTFTSFRIDVWGSFCGKIPYGKGKNRIYFQVIKVKVTVTSQKPLLNNFSQYP